MNVDLFWEIIEKVRDEIKYISDFSECLSKELQQLCDNDLLIFQLIYEYYEIKTILNRSHMMWSALILVNGGYCTNTYGFAGWLITNGKDAYYGVFKDADHLANYNPKKDKCNYDQVRHLAQGVYMERTKTKIKKFKSIYSELWKSEVGKNIQREIDENLIINETKRKRDWTMQELEELFPRLALAKK